ncbi:MAG TPA: hypothetical protein VN544_10735 [Gaiellaceae bacterium]|nr:hypothetical protein [Gaiellaceae bacterium]
MAVSGGSSASATRFGCVCGRELQVYGRDRHRRYYELDDAAHVMPVMTRVCPGCGHGLPGKNAR